MFSASILKNLLKFKGEERRAEGFVRLEIEKLPSRKLLATDMIKDKSLQL